MIGMERDYKERMLKEEDLLARSKEQTKGDGSKESLNNDEIMNTNSLEVNRWKARATNIDDLEVKRQKAIITKNNDLS